jgi:alpha-galactosidase
MQNINFETTLDQREALIDAKYVISTFMVGGYESYKIDLDIPFKYGVTQNVGDTMGPGGVFRFLRNVPVYKSLIENLREVGYQADQKKRVQPLHLNYTNPMAMNTWYCNYLWPDSTVGLCHSIQHSGTLLQLFVGAQPNEIAYAAAGINHMAWFYDLHFKDSMDPNGKWVDAYPRLWENFKEDPKVVGAEKLRWDMMKATGYWMTESSGHLSEYLPFYRKRQDLLDKFAGSDWGFASLKHGVDQINFEKESIEADNKAEAEGIQHVAFKRTASEEYVSCIMNAMETDVPFKFYGNVMNKKGGLITNLPADCCVEVPVLVDSYGLRPQGGIELPTICQGLCASNVYVQKAAVEAALTKDPEKVYHALLLDPNTASVCSPEEIHAMVDELFEAEKLWLGWFFE